jgi:hypothetical protein
VRWGLMLLGVLMWWSGARGCCRAWGFSPATVRSDNNPRVRFFATLGEEPEVEVEVVQRLGERALLTRLRADTQLLADPGK